MIRSMTGYGKAEAVLAGKKFLIEMKSVNHRFLEISLRMPGMLLPLESEIKKKIGERFSRGRIEVTIRVDGNGISENENRFTLNLPLARNYYALLNQLKEEFHLSDEITMSMMAGFRDAFVSAESVSDPTSWWEGISSILDEAIRLLAEMRIKEGESLNRDLSSRLDMIARFLDQITDRAPRVVLEYQRRLTDRIRELTSGVLVDETRLLQEVAIMAEKSDITEEIIRFRSHIEQFTELLMGNDAAGRKIDFLIQEMGREINTIGSKSGDVEISRNVIDIKSELAKLREQVQNLE
jgi:uncharacterized protein (TIGR00255 family)